MGKVSDAGIFFAQFIKSPNQLGSVIPSSGFLKRRLIRQARLASAKVVVELGPGSAGTTKAFLGAMKADAVLLTIELNPRLHALTSQIDDPRLISHHGSAADLADVLQQYGLGAPDVVISGIPFSTMDPDLGTLIIDTVHEQLSANGRFVAYQFNSRVDELNTAFGENKTLEIEFLNFPPVRVWCWQKTS